MLGLLEPTLLSQILVPSLVRVLFFVVEIEQNPPNIARNRLVSATRIPTRNDEIQDF